MTSRPLVIGGGCIHARGSEREDEVPMLVVSRKMNEAIVIYDNIVVTVVAVAGDKVRLGIEAPKEVSVHRREVYQALKQQERP